jgi:hypothetical protein
VSDHFAASLVFVFFVLGFLVSSAVSAPKPIEIIHAPRVMFAGGALSFQVRIRGAIDEDRVAVAMLCEVGQPCGLGELEHLLFTQQPIEGSAAQKLWAPRAWTHIPEGEYVLIAALGHGDVMRARDMVPVLVQGMQ